MPHVMAAVSRSTGPWPFPSLSRGRGNKMMDPWGPSDLPSWFSEPQQEGCPQCELHKDRDHTCGIPVPGMATHAPFMECPRPSPSGISYISTLPWPIGSLATSAGAPLCLLPSPSAQARTRLAEWESHGSVFVRCCF